MLKNIFKLKLILLLTISWLSGCGSNSSEDDGLKVTAISIISSDTKLPSNSSTQLEIIAMLSDSSIQDIDADVVWESNNPEIASINDSGLLETKDLSGNVIVSATYKTFTESKEILIITTPPNIYSTPIVVATEGEVYTYDVEVDAAGFSHEYLSYMLEVFPEGMVIDSKAGIISWVPGEDAVGSQEVIVNVSNEKFPSLSSEQKFVIDVDMEIPVINNDKPIITSNPITSAVADVEYSYNVLAVDVNKDTLTYLLDTAPEGMSINSSGSISWLPKADQEGLYIVRIAVVDNALEALTAYQQFIVEVQPANVAPSFVSTPLLSAKEESHYLYDVIVDDDHAVTFSLNDMPSGMVIDEQSGKISWTPAIDQSGEHKVIVVAVDNGTPSLSSVQEFSIVVTESNLPPVFTSVAITQAVEESQYEYKVSVDDVNITTFSLVFKPNGMSIDSESGLISWTPTNDQSGEHKVTVMVVDNGTPSFHSMQEFSLIVTESNVPPVFTSVANTQAVEESQYEYKVSVDDVNNTSFSLVSKPDGMSIDKQTGLISWLPADNQVGSYFVVVKATDDGMPSMSKEQSFELLVEESNIAPVIATSYISEVQLGTEYIYQIVANDVNGDNLKYTLIDFPENMTVNESTGVIHWLPSAQHVGLNNLSVKVIDDGVPNLSDTKSFSILVLDKQAPTVPSELQVKAVSSSRINLKWNISSDNVKVAEYNVFRDGLFVDSVVDPFYSSSGLSANTTYSFSVIAVDDSQNMSAESTSEMTTTLLVDLPISDNFDTGSTDKWTIIDDLNTEPSAWAVVNGEYIQTNERGILLSSKSRRTALSDATYHIGTYGLLNNGFDLTDYRVSVDMTPIAGPVYSLTDDGHDIGVMFRYQDENNYYRISLNSEYGYARLESKVNGVFNTLATDARGYRGENILIHIDIEVAGDYMQIFIDGEARFSAWDSSLVNGSIALYTQDGAKFDNVVIDYNNFNPSIVFDRPLAYTSLVGSDVAVSAVVLNKPFGGTVEFEVDGSSCGSVIESSIGYFESTCSLLSQGEHTFTTKLLDSNGNVLSTDINSMVGTSGDVRIVVGDSISNGVTDTFNGDSQSTDGKVIGEQGYVSVLQSLLSTSSPVPQIIYNEGVPGDVSKDLLDLRLPSILERHPDANIAQLMIGTNDSNKNVPSGLGCIGSACENTYKGNIQSIVNNLIGAGVTPVIAQIPPSFKSDSQEALDQNQLIQEYNAILRNDFSAYTTGPDFNTYFLNAEENRESLFVDNFHLNGLGYKIMGHLWEHAINVGGVPNRIELPLVLENICVRLTSSVCQTPLLYKQDLMQIGNPYYIDAPDAVNNIPVTLNDGVWIRTSYDDRLNTRSDFLSFNVDRNVEVYVAYDASATSLPNWLDSFVRTGESLEVESPNVTSLELYKKSYPAGLIQLGANLAVGAVGSNSSYVVIVKEI